MTGLIILAAGASTRLGRPKQLLQYEGESLILRSIRFGTNAECNPVIVVTGAYSDKIIPEIDGDDVQIINNSMWEEGMASSIRAGISSLQQNYPETEEVIIMLCDQPMVDASLLNSLIREKKRSGKEIVACSYKNTIGVPVLFTKTFFPELLALKGDVGAKKILFRHKENIATIPFPAGTIDIDTVSDYKALK